MAQEWRLGILAYELGLTGYAPRFLLLINDQYGPGKEIPLLIQLQQAKNQEFNRSDPSSKQGRPPKKESIVIEEVEFPSRNT